MTNQAPPSREQRAQAAAALRKIGALIEQEKVEDARARNFAAILTFTLLALLFGVYLFTVAVGVKRAGDADGAAVVILFVASLLASLSLVSAYHFATRKRHRLWSLLAIGVSVAIAITGLSAAWIFA